MGEAAIVVCGMKKGATTKDTKDTKANMMMGREKA